MKTRMMNLLCGGAAIAVFCSGEAKAEYSERVEGSKLIVNVDKGDEREIATFPAGVTEFLKTGTGMLTVSAANAGLTGDAEISAGIVKITNKGALGSNKGSIIVSDKAQLAIEIPKVGQFEYAIEKRLQVSGNGPDGTGAVTMKTGAWLNEDCFFKKIVVASGATALISSLDSSRYGISGTDLDGGTLILGGSGTYMFSGSSHASAGTIQTKCSLTMQNGQTFAGGAEGCLVVDGTVLSLYSGVFNCPWTVRFKAGSTLKANGLMTEAGQNVIAGPVCLDGDLTINQGSGAGPHSLKFAGKVSGSGKITKWGTNLDLVFASAENDFTGIVTIGNGTAEFSYPGSLPGYSTAGRLVLSSSDCLVRLPFGEGSWDGASHLAASSAASYGNANARVIAWTEEGVTAADTADFSFTRFSHGGDGVLVFSGGVKTDGSTFLENRGGTLKVSGNVDRLVQTIKVMSGTMFFDNAGYLFDGTSKDAHSWGTWSVGGSGLATTAPARMILAGTSTLDSTVETHNNWSAGTLNVGDTGAAGAILEMRSGAALTNCVAVAATAQNAKGAIHQFGGRLYNAAVAGNTRYFGRYAGSYAYNGVWGGTNSFKAVPRLAAEAGATAIFDVCGDDSSLAMPGVYLGGAGWAEIHLAGGTTKLTGQPYLGQQADFVGASGQQAVLTMSSRGNPQLNIPWQNLLLCNRTNDYAAVVNLNGGLAEICGIARDTAFAVDRLNTKAYLNCGGGTVKGCFHSASFFGTGASALDRITLFKGGLRINPNNLTLQQASDTPFVAPEGRGVAAIALPMNFENGKYIGAPEVRIVGGGGTGATAHALYDPATLSVTNIEVTCPGWNYTSAPAVTIASADRTSTFACTATLTDGDQVSGGITVMNDGSFVLNAVNTYTGDTVLDGGVLKATVSGAIPSASTVVFGRNGKLDLAEGIAGPTKYAVDCATALTRTSGCETWSKVNFPSGSTLEVRNADLLPKTAKAVPIIAFLGGMTGKPTLTGFDAEKFNVRFVGNVVKASRREGLILLVR